MNFLNSFSNFSRNFIAIVSAAISKLWSQVGSDINGEFAGDQSGYSVSMNSTGDRVAIGAILNTPTNSARGHVRIYSWSGIAWTQLGADINGEAAGDNSGWSVSMNAVGDRVAIGSIYNEGVGIESGHVRVYSWNGTAWTQLGTDIDGEAAEDKSGCSVSMNAVGDRVAIGAITNDGTADSAGHVRIYSWNGTAWTQLGADIDGEALGDYSGFSVSMNSVGDRVAIGAIYNNITLGNARGHTRIYSWNGTAWTQLGADIDGEVAGDQSGQSVSMNAAGDRVAIGASLNDGTGSNAGHVRIYSWNGAAWTQLGTDINGEAIDDESGYSVSMNDTGDRVAIGAIGNDGTGFNAGHVRVYSWNGTAWTKLSADIDGEAAGDSSGLSVSMNAVGDKVAIGAIYNDGTGPNAGHVRIYSYADDIVLSQLGADIDGESAGDNSAIVSMNASGDRMAIGGNLNRGNGTDSGHVRVYSFNGTAWTQLGADINGEAVGDNSGYSISMNAVGDRVAIGAPFNGVNDNGHVRIYSWNGATWTQLGADIDGEAAGDNSGWSVSMNAVGDRVAIGAKGNYGADEINTQYIGHVRIYSWNGAAWVQLGADIDGEAVGDQSGYVVSMNAAGDRVAIGAPFNGVDQNGANYKGHVRIYYWNGAAWTQLGADIDGQANLDQSGRSVSMNAAGDRVAIGVSYNDGNGIDSGNVRIYSWNGTTWVQLGVDIDGEAARDESGYSVSMNAAGDRVAIGAIKNDGTGTNAGHVRIYYWNGTTWIKLNADIDGETAGDFSGWSVSMNASGNRVAIGAIFNDGNGSDSSHVRVYSLV
jgi:hypothetical protein